MMTRLTGRAITAGEAMTDQPVTDVPGVTQSPQTRLEANAIGAVQDTVMGMANSAPTVSTGLTLATLTLAAAYAVGPVIVLTAIPMIIIANAYRKLNLDMPHDRMAEIRRLP
jgi:hypothetical protein